MRRRFLQRSPRERLLLLLFLGAAGLVWLASAGGRWQQRWRAQRAVAGELAAQQLWIERKAAIEQRAVEAARRLEPAKTLDATRLVGEISAVAARLGLAVGMEPPRTERTGQFAYHTVQVAVRRADLAGLVAFYRELGQRAPYLALDRCSLAANRSNPAEIEAVFAVFSVEVAP